MFNLFYLPVIENLLGQKIPALIGNLDGSTVTERTVRNWLKEGRQPSAEQVDALHAASLATLQARMVQGGWSDYDASRYVAGVSATAGLLGGFVYAMSAGNDYRYDRTLDLAVQTDDLSCNLLALRNADDLAGCIDGLLQSPLITMDHFVDPDGGTLDAEAVRTSLVNAVRWTDLAKPLNIVYINLMMQLLATLDLEFGAHYLREFEATPIFQALMPRLNPETTPNDAGHFPATRDLFHLPVRRLLELVSCLYHLKKTRKWPEQIPSVKQMALWMDAPEAHITKWRMGRRFTLYDFDTIWERMFGALPDDTRPGLPTPLTFCAAVLTGLYVKGARETRDLEMIIPDPEIYLRWWRHQRALFEKQGLTFGASPWMSSLS